MRPCDVEWTAEEVERLHDLYTVKGMSMRACGRELNRDSSSISGKVNRMRAKEGATRWPQRPSPIPVAKKQQPAKRIPRGVSTLPPL